MYSSIPNTSSGIIYKITIKNKGLTSGVLDYTFVSTDNSNIKYKIGRLNSLGIINVVYANTLETISSYSKVEVNNHGKTFIEIIK